jgi:hypothetical protein
MVKKWIIPLIFIFIFLNFFVVVHAGITITEGSLEIKAMEKKKVCGIVCVFSVYETPYKYNIEISGNLGKFIDNIEPETFTLNGIQCPMESEARRQCIRNLCNDPNSTSTRMPCIYFTGPLEFSFDTCNGIPCRPNMQKFEGSIKTRGFIGAATTIEPLSFIIYYTPMSGWPFLIFAIIIIILIIVIILRKFKKIRSYAMYCEKCGKKFKKSKYCPECGSPLVEK